MESSVLTALYSMPSGAPPMSMNTSGETTPSVRFSATVSTAALITPSSDSSAVSRPTYHAMALRPSSSDCLIAP